MKPIYIYGASGHGKVVYELAKLSGYQVKGFIDDTSKAQIFGYEPITFQEFLDHHKECLVVLAIGDNRHREKVYKKLTSHAIAMATLIHPKACVSSFASIKEGTVVMAGAVINPDTKVGKCAIINTGAVIDHDCLIADFVHIAPNASLAGAVQVGKSSFIGIGSCVMQCLMIAKDVTVGAGSVVVHDLSQSKVYKGSPAQ